MSSLVIILAVIFFFFNNLLVISPLPTSSSKNRFNSLSGEFFADSAGYANINNLNLNFDVGDAEIVGTISSKLESFDTFNLEMSFNTSLSQNIPWYVAILGGFPAAAGAVVVTEVLEDGINQITETKYGISGSADNLIVETRQ